MPRPCDHAGQPPVPSCRVCELYALRPDYRRLWGDGDIMLNYAQLPVSQTPEEMRAANRAAKPRVAIGDLAKRRG